MGRSPRFSPHPCLTWQNSPHRTWRTPLVSPTAAEPQPRLLESAYGKAGPPRAFSDQLSDRRYTSPSIAVKSQNKPAKRCALPSPIAQSRRVSLTQPCLLHRKSEVFQALQRKDSEVSTLVCRPLHRHCSTNFLLKRGEVKDEDSIPAGPESPPTTRLMCNPGHGCTFRPGTWVTGKPET